MLTCTCGRKVNACRSAGSHSNTRCLICQTAAIMQTFRDPMTARKKKTRKKAVHNG